MTHILEVPTFKKLDKSKHWGKYICMYLLLKIGQLPYKKFYKFSANSLFLIDRNVNLSIRFIVRFWFRHILAGDKLRGIYIYYTSNISFCRVHWNWRCLFVSNYIHYSVTKHPILVLSSSNMAPLITFILSTLYDSNKYSLPFNVVDSAEDENHVVIGLLYQVILLNVLQVYLSFESELVLYLPWLFSISLHT